MGKKNTRHRILTTERKQVLMWQHAGIHLKDLLVESDELTVVKTTLGHVKKCFLKFGFHEDKKTRSKGRLNTLFLSAERFL